MAAALAVLLVALRATGYWRNLAPVPRVCPGGRLLLVGRFAGRAVGPGRPDVRGAVSVARLTAVQQSFGGSPTALLWLLAAPLGLLLVGPLVDLLARLPALLGPPGGLLGLRRSLGRSVPELPWPLPGLLVSLLWLPLAAGAVLVVLLLSGLALLARTWLLGRLLFTGRLGGRGPVHGEFRAERPVVLVAPRAGYIARRSVH